ncbi:hypothetical protein KI387_015156, partial [Taxus chinensis]
VEQFIPTNTSGIDYLVEFDNKSKRDKRNKKQILQATGTSEPTTIRVLPTYNPDTDTVEYMYVVPKVVKPENEMVSSDYEMTSLQMDLKEMKPSDKINVSKRNNDVVYTALLKVEREKYKLNNKIQKLEADLANEKAKGKASVNRTCELERKIKSSSSMTAVVVNEQAQVELEEVKKML